LFDQCWVDLDRFGQVELDPLEVDLNLTDLAGAGHDEFEFDQGTLDLDKLAQDKIVLDGFEQNGSDQHEFGQDEPG